VTEGRLGRDKLSQKEAIAIRRAICGLHLIRGILTGTGTKEPGKLLRTLWGEKEFRDISKRIVKNSYRTDIHFLPCDSQPTAFSGVSTHSVALFRYPLSLPLDILDAASVPGNDEWAVAAGALTGAYPCAKMVVDQRPLKVLCVRPRFMSDILTRFTALYGRIGSPDFSAVAVEKYSNEISGMDV
jgi:hypothetical protein